MARTKAKSDQLCVWSEDEDGNWITTCGQMFVFTAEGPSGNGMKFCCYCGAPLKELGRP